MKNHRWWKVKICWWEVKTQHVGQHVQQANWVKFVNPAPKLPVLKIRNCYFHSIFFLCVGVIFFWFPILQTTTAKPLWFAKSHIHQRIFPKKTLRKKKKKHRKRRVSSESFVNMNTVPALLRPARWSFLRRRVGTWRIIPWLASG